MIQPFDFVLHLGFTNSQIQYTLHGCLINDAQNVTDLGVDIDCKLKYDAHINNIIGKAYARVGVFFTKALPRVVLIY